MNILEEIKNKKEFRGLSDDFVSRVMVLYSNKYDIYDKKQKKELIKQTRAKLRDLHSAFRLRNYNKKEKYLNEMTIWNDKEQCTKILKLHISTNERLDHYDKLYSKLQKKIQFKSVLDLGCGLNVFSLPWMERFVTYYGVDVNKDDVDFCNDYLRRFALGGAVRLGDVMSFSKFMKADVTFMFKMLEALEQLERGSTEELFKRVTSPYIVASFATRSLGGKKPISARRLKWFEKLVDYQEKFKLGDEIYYVIKR
jgi:16S rRNA (guanine(1405)-N(7))-methyltransferase